MAASRRWFHFLDHNHQYPSTGARAGSAMHFSNVVITGGEYTEVTTRPPAGSRGLDLLRASTAPSAFHNSAERYDPPRCHPRTREAILAEIMAWVHNAEKLFFIIWLYGPAGAGKSAIAQTIAEMCFKAGLLAASFFFSKTVDGRNHDSRLIVTLAYQLTISIPEIRQRVGYALEVDPLILSKSLEAQMQMLIVDPLNEAANDETDGPLLRSRPRFFVIDGLDECSPQESQVHIINILFGAIKRLSIPFFCLIASRPEQLIRDAFNRDEFIPTTTRIILDDSYEPDADIEVFLRAGFDGIRKSHPVRMYLPADWPTHLQINRLVQKSSGQFIYASTIIEYIKSYQHHPTKRLDTIFGLVPPTHDQLPFAELDALYTHILSSVAEVDRVLDVLSIFLTMVGMSTATNIEDLLCYERGEVQFLLSDLHSILRVPPPESERAELWLLHASFRDFLVDRSRAGRFFIDISKAYQKLVISYIKRVNLLTEQSPDVWTLRGRFGKTYQRSTVTPELAEELSASFVQHQFKWLEDHASHPSELWDFIFWVYNIEITHHVNLLQPQIRDRVEPYWRNSSWRDTRPSLVFDLFKLSNFVKTEHIRNMEAVKKRKDISMSLLDSLDPPKPFSLRPPRLFWKKSEKTLLGLPPPGETNSTAETSRVGLHFPTKVNGDSSFWRSLQSSSKKEKRLP